MQIPVNGQDLTANANAAKTKGGQLITPPADPKDQVVAGATGSTGIYTRQDSEPVPKGNPQPPAGVEHNVVSHLGGVHAGIAVQAADIGGPKDRRPDREILQDLSHQAMIENNLKPDFTAEALQQAHELSETPNVGNLPVRDERGQLWSSIDNDATIDGKLKVTSQDLDQIGRASEILKEGKPTGDFRLNVGVSYIRGAIPKGSAVDEQAKFNTTSVYPAGKIYPLMPPEVSEDKLSLQPDKDRLAICMEMVVHVFDPKTGKADENSGKIVSYEPYLALVNNHAKLGYQNVCNWLEKPSSPPPPEIAKVPGMDKQILMQHQISQALRTMRIAKGSLQFKTIKPEAEFNDVGNVVNMKDTEMNLARQLIEEEMVATNTCSAMYLLDKGRPTMARVVKDPMRWAKIVAYCKDRDPKCDLPSDVADKEAGIKLQQFLVTQRERDPENFPLVSLDIVKLMGRGEYEVQTPQDAATGHFALAIIDYAHTTAGLRRRADQIQQALLVAAMTGQDAPYTVEEMRAEAKTCTEQEGNSTKVERRMTKSAAALKLRDDVGKVYQGKITWSSPEKGTWAMIMNGPAYGVEVRLHKANGMREGTKLPMRLESVNVQKGWIDFEALHGRGGGRR